MTRELELAAAGSASGLLGRSRRRPEVAHAYTQCPNCGAALQGRYCHDCGQSNDDHHRSIFHLMWEAVEGLTHLDGRLARTLPPLLFHPGRLARDHIEGRRMRHVPPFRLFLISLLIFMFAMEALVHGEHGGGVREHGPPAKGAPVHGAVTLAPVPIPTPPRADGARPVPTVDPGGVMIGSLDDALSETAENKQLRRTAVGTWLHDHVSRASANRAYYTMVLFTWAHRLAVLMLPIFALLLTAMYFYKRRLFVYDHLVVSMQFLSFVFLISALAWAAPPGLRIWTVTAAIVWTPVNLYLLLRGGYGSSRIGAAAKTLVLWVSAQAVFLTLLMGLMTLALAQM